MECSCLCGHLAMLSDAATCVRRSKTVNEAAKGFANKEVSEESIYNFSSLLLQSPLVTAMGLVHRCLAQPPPGASHANKHSRRGTVTKRNKRAPYGTVNERVFLCCPVPMALVST